MVSIISQNTLDSKRGGKEYKEHCQDIGKEKIKLIRQRRIWINVA
jgi:hypothetical protein